MLILVDILFDHKYTESPRLVEEGRGEDKLMDEKGRRAFVALLAADTSRCCSGEYVTSLEYGV